MKEIKTKYIIKNIKALDKAADVTRRAKNAYIRAKEQAEQRQQTGHDNFVEYAENKIKEGTKIVAHETGHATERQAIKAVRKIKVHRATKIVKDAAKDTIKMAQRSVKTAEHMAKASFKTYQTAKTAAKTAQATQRAAQATRAAARAGVISGKTAVKAMLAAIKAIIAAVNGMIALIAAGGWMALAIIIVICLAGFLSTSAFGVLFSNENYDANTPKMKEIVSQINEEFAAELQRIQNEIPHNTLDLTSNGTGTNVGNWRDILVLYAVKVTSESEKGMEVATLDVAKVGILRDVFWDMNKIDYWVETIEHTESTTSIDKDGNVIDETYTTTETILHINVTFKSYKDMIFEYGFNSQQVKILNELMQDEYQEMFMQLIGS